MAVNRKIPAVKCLFMVINPSNFQVESMTGVSAVEEGTMAYTGWKVAGTAKTGDSG
jgi:hypothetical protein